jgi:glycosyltransferase involved in cell wall biosynthesis
VTSETSKRKPTLLLLSPTSGFGGGVERVMAAVEDAWPGRVVRVDLYRSDHTTRASGQPRLKVGFALRALWAFVRARPDLILAGHLGQMPVAAPLALGRPLALWGHGREVWPKLPRWERFLVRRCARILTSSEFTARELAARAGIPYERFTAVPLPIGGSFDAVLEDPERKPSDDRPPTLLSVSRVAPDCRYKGLFLTAEAMLEIVERRPDVRWVVVGSGPDLPLLARRVEELGIADRVDLRGAVDEDGLLAAYREADLFVLPSHADPEAEPPVGEGFGLVYAEAGAFSLPSVAARTGGGSLEFVEPGVTGEVAPIDDPRRLAGTIVDLLDDHELRTRLGQAARERVRARHRPLEFRLAFLAALRDIA